ncbi:hypothetical protein [Dongia sp.]|uniref:hypothetical protein n=1 Tax=Dongia sp. TaxID=1977262 RepID=UPI0035B2D8B2
MKVIDEKSLVADPQGTLTNAAAGGGAFILLNNGVRVAVIDADLWDHLQPRLPSLADFVKDIKKS